MTVPVLQAFIGDMVKFSKNAEKQKMCQHHLALRHMILSYPPQQRLSFLPLSPLQLELGMGEEERERNEYVQSDSHSHVIGSMKLKIPLAHWGLVHLVCLARQANLAASGHSDFHLIRTSRGSEALPHDFLQYL